MTGRSKADPGRATPASRTDPNEKQSFGSYWMLLVFGKDPKFNRR